MKNNQQLDTGLKQEENCLHMVSSPPLMSQTNCILFPKKRSEKKNC